jgi:hypothetical protein
VEPPDFAIAAGSVPVPCLSLHNGFTWLCCIPTCGVTGPLLSGFLSTAKYLLMAVGISEVKIIIQLLRLTNCFEDNILWLSSFLYFPHIAG